MSENLLNTIKNERRRNLGKRFNIWITAQWGYEKGSFNDIPFGNIIHIDTFIFKELLRDCRLKEILY